MKPLVIEYLKTHSLRELEDEHGVCSRPSNDFTKVSLNYNQILIKNGDLLAEQCRGVVVYVDIKITEDTWQDTVFGKSIRLAAWPMDRFYNHGDVACAEVDWSDPHLNVFEKLDGTMCVLYWDRNKNEWHVATRSVPEADLPILQDDVGLGDTTYSGLFWRAFHATVHPEYTESVLFNLNRGLTYVFELTSPYNRVVVKYDSVRITLLAARHTESGKELSTGIESLGLSCFSRPKTWLLNNAEALVAFVNVADPSTLEGAVVCDSQFRRIKIKNKAWVLSSKAKDLVTVSRRGALEAILQNKIDDIIPIIEESIAKQLTEMQDAVRTYFKQIDANFIELRDAANGDRKTFALSVMATQDWSPVYFGLWEKKASSALEWMAAASSGGKLSHGSLDLILSRLRLVTSGDNK